MKLFDLFEHKNNRLQLNELNLVNLDAVQQTVDAYANKVTSPEAKQWFQKNVRNYLVNSPKDNEQLSQGHNIPDDSPEWLKKAMASGTPLFSFKIDNQTKQELDHIADYLNSEEGAPLIPKLFKVT